MPLRRTFCSVYQSNVKNITNKSDSCVTHVNNKERKIIHGNIAKKKSLLEYKIYGDAKVQFHIGCLTTNVSDMGRIK